MTKKPVAPAKVPEREHALLSASSAKIWIHCPPAPRLMEDLEDEGSEYANEGKLAHAIGEAKVKRYLEAITSQKFGAELKTLRSDPLYTKEMERHTDEYLDHIKGIVHSYPARPYMAVELRVDYGHIAPEGFGTADFVAVGSDVLDVVDLKYGKGVRVEALENEQLKLYALGVLKRYEALFPITRVRLTIYQPRMDNVSTWETTAAELLAWGACIKPVAEMAFRGDGECLPGEWCTFCRAKTRCRARANSYTALEDFGGRLPPLLSDEEVGDVLKRAEGLKSWADAVEQYALATVLKGGVIPGWKAVEGRGARKYTDMDQAFAACKAAGVDEAVLYNREPLSPAQLETLLGKKEFARLADPYVEKAPGKPTLVPVTDDREPMRRATAADDFGQPAPAEHTSFLEPANGVPGAYVLRWDNLLDQLRQCYGLNGYIAAPATINDLRAMYTEEEIIAGHATLGLQYGQAEPPGAPVELLDKMRRFYGLPPHDNPQNTDRQNGWYCSAIRRDYSQEQILAAGRYLGVLE